MFNVNDVILLILILNGQEKIQLDIDAACDFLSSSETGRDCFFFFCSCC